MTIGVFFGGKSPEHDISIITGQLILNGLRRLGHDAHPIYLDKEGQWHLGEEFGSIAFFKKKSRPATEKSAAWLIDLERSRGKMAFKRKGFFGKTIAIDLAFPAFHGRNGEDGTVQGLFEMLDIPYVGCGVTASAITIDKVLTKIWYEQAGFPTAKFIYFKKADWEKRRDDFINKINTGLAWPLFVKPARLGSSIGIARVANAKELAFALDVAFHYDEKAIVEESVPNAMDVTCAVIGNDAPRASLLQESLFSEGFFSYEDKYLTGGGAQTGTNKKGFVIPARLDEPTASAVKNLALQVFSKLECSGIARVDFLYDTAAKKIFVNEVNPLPGTLYHHLWEKSGMPLPELLTELIRLANERNESKRGITTSFSSNILAHADWSAKLGKK